MGGFGVSATTGHSVMALDFKKLRARFGVCKGRVKYRLGAKPSFNDQPGHDFFKSDCSGFVRWLLFEATGGLVKLDEGSWHQRAWCDNHGFKLTDYILNASVKDGRLRIAFISPPNGHVWLVLDGKTYECYSGKGVGSRSWDSRIEGGKSSLARAVDFCYVLTDPEVRS